MTPYAKAAARVSPAEKARVNAMSPVFRDRKPERIE
jgi:hypothetical protein